MERAHARPFDTRRCGKLREKHELRVARRKHHVGLAACADCGPEHRRGLGRGVARHRVDAALDAHVQRVDTKFTTHANWGSHCAVAASISSVICSTWSKS